MTARPRELEEQLSVAQVAERLGVVESTVWRWVKLGRFKTVHKLGRRIVRIPASSVNRFLDERKV